MYVIELEVRLLDRSNQHQARVPLCLLQRECWEKLGFLLILCLELVPVSV